MLTFCFNMNAQDIITFKNGTQIKVKIIQRNAKTVHYFYHDKLQGPEYFISVDEIATIQIEDKPAQTVNMVQSNLDTETDRVKKFFNGPRIGVTYCSPGTISRSLADKNVSPVFSMMGWQFETRFFHNPSGSHFMFEFVPMVGAIEQGSFLPTASFLLGYRTTGGVEFGFGPNLSPSGSSMVFSMGRSFESNVMVYPVNLVFVPSTKSFGNAFLPEGRTGARLSLIFGFNTKSQNRSNLSSIFF